MGCCESFPDNNGLSSSFLTQNERKNFEQIITSIPIHCREDIINLALPKQFLNAYQYHLWALFHFQRNEYLLAISNERIAITQMGHLLPYRQDHFIFAAIYKLLEVCLWHIGEIKLSLLIGHIVLNITIKYTPTDYTEISLQYCRLAFISLSGEAWKGAERYFMKTIELARLSNELPQDYIQEIEEFLAATR
jgi:hypothetical protein